MKLLELSWESLHCDLLIGLRTAIFCGRLAKSATHSQLLVEWQTMIRVGWEEAAGTPQREGRAEAAQQCKSGMYFLNRAAREFDREFVSIHNSFQEG